MSVDLFNVKSDPLLNKLSSHPDTFSIGTTKIGAVIVADDLAITSSTPHGLQSLVRITEQDAAEKKTHL